MSKSARLWVAAMLGLFAADAARAQLPPGAAPRHREAKEKDARHKERGAKDGEKKEEHAVRADVLAWLLAHNPGLGRDFLEKDPPEKTIVLPDGRTVPIYRLKQFLQVNFKLHFHRLVPAANGFNLGETEEHLRKILATPEFRDRILHYKPEYVISPRGKVSAGRAYDYIRDIHRDILVSAHKNIHAPVGGGNGISAPSWAVWKRMNLFWHETCHCIGIGHNSGGISGPIAGSMRKWDRKKLWNYETIDLNAVKLPG